MPVRLGFWYRRGVCDICRRDYNPHGRIRGKPDGGADMAVIHRRRVDRDKTLGDCAEVALGMKKYVYYVSYYTGQGMGCCTSKFTKKINDWNIDDFKNYNHDLAYDFNCGQAVATNFIFLREEDKDDE